MRKLFDFAYRRAVGGYPWEKLPPGLATGDTARRTAEPAELIRPDVASAPLAQVQTPTEGDEAMEHRRFGC